MHTSNSTRRNVSSSEGVSFLGHVVSNEGVSTEVSAIANWPTPVSISELQSFLGLASY